MLHAVISSVGTRPHQRPDGHLCLERPWGITWWTVAVRRNPAGHLTFDSTAQDVFAASGVAVDKLVVVGEPVSTAFFDPALARPMQLPVGDLVFGADPAARQRPDFAFLSVRASAQRSADGFSPPNGDEQQRLQGAVTVLPGLHVSQQQ